MRDYCDRHIDGSAHLGQLIHRQARLLAEDPLEVARKEAADVVIIKVAPLGGVRAALRVARKSGLCAT